MQRKIVGGIYQPQHYMAGQPQIRADPLAPGRRSQAPVPCHSVSKAGPLHEMKWKWGVGVHNMYIWDEIQMPPGRLGARGVAFKIQ